MTTEEEDALFAELEQGMADVVIQDLEVIPALDTASLLRRFAAVERELREMSEMLEPRSDRGFELHQARGLMLIELKKRRLR